MHRGGRASLLPSAGVHKGLSEGPCRVDPQCLDHHNPPPMEKQKWWGQDSSLADLQEKIDTASCGNDGGRGTPPLCTSAQGLSPPPPMCTSTGRRKGHPSLAHTCPATGWMESLPQCRAAWGRGMESPPLCTSAHS